MEEKYHKGYVFPDEFYKEYTDFNSHKDFVMKAKEEGIGIIQTKTQYGFKLSNLVTEITTEDAQKIVDNFIAKHSKFKTQKEMVDTAKNIYKDPPSLLSKSLIRNKIAIAGFLARDKYELECNMCHKHITINKEAVIPKCNCSNFSQYIIIKIF